MFLHKIATVEKYKSTNLNYFTTHSNYALWNSAYWHLQIIIILSANTHTSISIKKIIILNGPENKTFYFTKYIIQIDKADYNDTHEMQSERSTFPSIIRIVVGQPSKLLNVRDRITLARLVIRL